MVGLEDQAEVCAGLSGVEIELAISGVGVPGRRGVPVGPVRTAGCIVAEVFVGLEQASHRGVPAVGADHKGRVYGRVARHAAQTHSTDTVAGMHQPGDFTVPVEFGAGVDGGLLQQTVEAVAARAVFRITIGITEVDDRVILPQAQAVGRRTAVTHGVAHADVVQNVHAGRMNGVRRENLVSAQGSGVNTQDASALSGQKTGERGTGTASANDDDVVVGCRHGHLLYVHPHGQCTKPFSC